jgi:hypothetical protein
VSQQTGVQIKNVEDQIMTKRKSWISSINCGQMICPSRQQMTWFMSNQAQMVNPYWMVEEGLKVEHNVDFQTTRLVTHASWLAF